MRTKLFLCIALTSIYLCNCSNQPNVKRARIEDKQAFQKDDGSILLSMDKAGLYIDENNPLNNTAEWDVEISKPGTYKVWLSNATRDTLDLRYPDKVRVNLSDSQLEGIPACDKIISNSEDVSYPYFRADSYMGFVNISEAGMYNVQVVSEMVIAKVPEKQSRSFTGKTILIGIMLSPTLK